MFTFCWVYIVCWIGCAYCTAKYYNDKRVKQQEVFDLVVALGIIIRVVIYSAGNALLLTLIICCILDTLGMYR